MRRTWFTKLAIWLLCLWLPVYSFAASSTLCEQASAQQDSVMTYMDSASQQMCESAGDEMVSCQFCVSCVSCATPFLTAIADLSAGASEVNNSLLAYLLPQDIPDLPYHPPTR